MFLKNNLFVCPTHSLSKFALLFLAFILLAVVFLYKCILRYLEYVLFSFLLCEAKEKKKEPKKKRKLAVQIRGLSLYYLTILYIDIFSSIYTLYPVLFLNNSSFFFKNNKQPIFYLLIVVSEIVFSRPASLVQYLLVLCLLIPHVSLPSKSRRVIRDSNP